MKAKIAKTTLVLVVVVIFSISLLLYKRNQSIDQSNTKVQNQVIFHEEKLEEINLSLKIPTTYKTEIKLMQSAVFFQQYKATLSDPNSTIEIVQIRHDKDYKIENITGGDPPRGILAKKSNFRYIGDLDNKKIYVDQPDQAKSFYAIYSSLEGDLENLVAWETPLWAVNSTYDQLIVSYTINGLKNNELIQKQNEIESIILSLQPLSKV